VGLVTLLPLAVYAAAVLAYLVYVVARREKAARVGRLVLTAGVVLHLVEIGTNCTQGRSPLSSTGEALSFVAFLAASGYAIASYRYRLGTGGAFVVPGVLALLVLARVAPAEPGTLSMGSALGRLHVFLATVGVAVFGLAAALAVVYLIEDRRLRQRRFSGTLGKEAPLATLDRLALRCVSVGFPIFTLALLTGAVWVARLGAIFGRMPLRPEYLFAVATWVAFGVMLLARVGAGWRGRRAAWLTLGGFASALLVLVGYFVRLVT
jgi:ABC-type uncharacterized transport system permease subunit